MDVSVERICSDCASFFSFFFFFFLMDSVNFSQFVHVREKWKIHRI